MNEAISLVLFFICEMYFICANHREINTHLNNKQVKLRSSIVIEKVKVKKLVNLQVVTGGKFYNITEPKSAPLSFDFIFGENLFGDPRETN